MNFNKCSRCGCFFLTEGTVCPNCQPKDQLEINRLKDYIAENTDTLYNMNSIISSTGISNKNLSRFLTDAQFSDFANQIEKNDLA